MKRNLLFMVILFVANSCCFSNSSSSIVDRIENTRSSDDAILIDYLKKLDVSSIGKKLTGIKISDDIELEGWIFLGKAVGFGKGVNIYLFSTANERVAYIWVEEGGDPLQLPDCECLPYIGSTTMTQKYTLKSVLPGNSVVICPCPKKSWFNSIGRIGRDSH